MPQTPAPVERHSGEPGGGEEGEGKEEEGPEAVGSGVATVASPRKAETARNAARRNMPTSGTHYNSRRRSNDALLLYARLGLFAAVDCEFRGGVRL